MSRKKNYKNNLAGIVDISQTFQYFMQRLESIAVSCFTWDGLPDTVSQRFLEMRLLHEGFALYFNDDIIGDIVLRAIIGGKLDMYDIPVDRVAFANNGYQRNLTNKDSVLIYDNMLHVPLRPSLKMFAQRLTKVEMTKDINIRAQKTPVMILCEDNQRLTMENLFMKIDTGVPVIFGSKNLDIDNVKTLDLKAPYVADKLHDEKMNLLHEAFSFLGVGSLEIEKKERLIDREVQESTAGNVAQRSSRLKARKEAADMINDMFNTNISVSYNPEVEEEANSFYQEVENS